MKFVLVLSQILIFIKILTCEMAITYRSRLANRKQQKFIQGSMDLDANPCENFYQYACGNWENLHREAGVKYLDTITMLDHTANKELSRVFNRINLRYQPKFVRSAYDYYKSCKDLTKYETVQYIKWLKENEDINLPLFWIPSETPVDFDWLKTLSTMRIYGLNNIFIEEIVRQRRSNPSKYIIYLNKPTKYGKFKPLTYEHLKLLVEQIRITMTTRSFSELWYEIKDFELKLMELDDIEDDVHNLYKTKVKNLPLPWLKEYLRIILNQTIVNPNMKIYLKNVPYMKALDELLKQYTQRFLCKYLVLRFLNQFRDIPPTNFFVLDCVSSVRSYLPLAVNWLYEQQHPELKQEFPKIMELYDNIRKHLNKTIFNNIYGFDSSTVEYLSAKLNNMQLKINNLPRIDTVHTLESFYRTLNLNASEFYANHLKLLKFDFEAHHNLLDATLPQKDFFYLENWQFESLTSSHFLRGWNIVVVPLTLLQQPIYHVNLDNIYKYSSLGFLLAHEIIHAFDYTGLQYDHKGKRSSKYHDIRNNPLYKASINCLLKFNSSVLDEKIADVSSLPFAYQVFSDFYPDALRQYRRIHGRDMSLSKLFFLNFAQFFCGTSNSQDFITSTIHGSERDRTMDILSQFPEFSKTFQCDSESRMTPHETCHMW